MAHPRRVARVAKQIERVVGNLLLYDRVLQEAVCPERRRGLDSAVSALASVTEVVVSGDLQVAKVYVSLFSDEQGKQSAMDGLTKLEGYVRKHIGREIRLRMTPEIRFFRDDSIERSERVLALLARANAQARGEVEPPPISISRSSEEVDGEDDEAKYADWIADLDEDDLDPLPKEVAAAIGLAEEGDDDGLFDDGGDEEGFFEDNDDGPATATQEPQRPAAAGGRRGGLKR